MVQVASSDLVNMGVSVVSYTIKDIRDDEVRDVCSLRWEKHRITNGVATFVFTLERVRVT